MLRHSRNQWYLDDAECLEQFKQKDAESEFMKWYGELDRIIELG